MKHIFISYRREDSADAARRLYERLHEHFISDYIFMDTDAIRLGKDFREKIVEAISTCDVVIAVIGRNWLNATDTEGQRRLDNPNDFVRLELATALNRNIPVVPTFVDGAVMPVEGKLPKDLAKLVRPNGLRIGDLSFQEDSDCLIAGLEAIFRGAYEDALDSYKQGYYDEAQAQLQEFLKKPRSALAPDASFGLGMSQYEHGDHESANHTLKRLTALWPNTDSAARALDAIMLFDGLEKDESSRQKFLEELIDRHPNSTAAARAKQYLPFIRPKKK